ncbi:MAG: Ig domain-containing protein [Candidatus Sericytochromatia bacterium]|nr:Ig domain-containing protein [Candidatus Tanganyikabacteria bacterium]
MAFAFGRSAAIIAVLASGCMGTGIQDANADFGAPSVNRAATPKPPVESASDGPTAGTGTASQAPRQPLHDKRPIKIDLSQTDLILPVKNSKTLMGTVTYENGTRDSSIKWSSSDETILSVDPNSGAITANKEGQATIIAAAITDPSLLILVNVTVRGAGVQDLIVRVSPATGSLQVGQTMQINATIQDSNGDQGGNVLWTSSNSAVAAVNAEGLVTGVVPGTATITAISQKDPTRRSSAVVTVGL